MAELSSRTIRVLAFAGARDVVGQSEVALDVTTTFPEGVTLTAARVMDAMCDRYPELTARRSIIRLAVNGKLRRGLGTGGRRR